MILMVVDGDKFNAGISDGVTSKELAGMMIMAGCNDALNFDGGDRRPYIQKHSAL